MNNKDIKKIVLESELIQDCSEKRKNLPAEPQFSSDNYRTPEDWFIFCLGAED